CEGGPVRLRRHVLQSRSNESQNTRCSDAFSQPRHKLLAGWVDPVSVLEDEQHWFLSSKLGQLIDERRDNRALALRRREIQRRISAVGGDRKQVGHEARRRSSLGPPGGEKRFQLLQLARRGIARRQASRPLEMPNDRV